MLLNTRELALPRRMASAEQRTNASRIGMSSMADLKPGDWLKVLTVHGGSAIGSAIGQRLLGRGFLRRVAPMGYPIWIKVGSLHSLIALIVYQTGTLLT